MALSLMTLIFVYFVGVLQSSLGFRGRLELQSQAVHVAQNKLDEVRAWAQIKTGGRYNYSRLASFQSSPQSDPSLPFLQTQVLVSDYTLASPNKLFEETHTTTPQRLMRESVKLLKIRVLRDGQELLSLPSLIHEPSRGWSRTLPIRISPASATLAKDAKETFRFTAYDEEDQPIPDLFCTWNIMPIDGLAMIDSQTRDGSQAVVMNHSRRRNGKFYHTGGTCRVTARIVYHGREQLGLSEILTLEGP